MGVYQDHWMQGLDAFKDHFSGKQDKLISIN